MSAGCRSCRATDVRWATMAVSGKGVLLEQTPCPPTARGALLLVDKKWAYTLDQLTERLALKQGIALTRARDICLTVYPAHLAHFARCPHADQHRRRRTSA